MKRLITFALCSGFLAGSLALCAIDVAAKPFAIAAGIIFVIGLISGFNPDATEIGG